MFTCCIISYASVSVQPKDRPTLLLSPSASSTQVGFTQRGRNVNIPRHRMGEIREPLIFSYTGGNDIAVNAVKVLYWSDNEHLVSETEL